jgi:hypothetical protein
MKKAWLALLLTSLFTTALVGCSSKQEPAQNTPAQQETPKQAAPSSNEPAASSPQPNNSEVRTAFGLSGDYLDLPSTAIPSLGLGQVEKLAIDQKQGLALAKAVSSAYSNSGWTQQDSPPSIFVTTDGSLFAIGMKKQDGSFTLETYELQTDGSYKSVSKQTK